MSKAIFIANLLDSLGELGTDAATGNWGGFVETAVDAAAQAALLGIAGKKDVNPWVKDAIDKDATHIIGLALMSLHAVDLLAGFAQEDQGDQFQTTRAWLEAAELALKAADPGCSWQGTASEAHATRVGELRKLVRDLIALDESMEDVIKMQAGEVDDLRNKIGYLQTGLIGAMAISILLWVNGGMAGVIASRVFQYAVSLAAVTTAVTFSGQMISKQLDNAGSVRKATDGYRTVASAALCTPGPATQTTVAAPATATPSIPGGDPGDRASIRAEVNGDAPELASPVAAGRATEMSPVPAAGIVPPMARTPTLNQLLARVGEFNRSSGSGSTKSTPRQAGEPVGAAAGARGPVGRAPSDRLPRGPGAGESNPKGAMTDVGHDLHARRPDQPGGATH